MNTQLSKEQIEQYRELGFLQFNDLLSPAELDHWRVVVAESVSRRGYTVILVLDAEKTKKVHPTKAYLAWWRPRILSRKNS